MRVLIVDDDPHFGLALRKTLQLEGLQVEQAQNIPSAFEKLRQFQADVLLLDLHLGEESGISMLRRLQESGNSIPVVMMTGEGSMDTVAEALQLHACDYVTKPFGKNEIVKILEQAVQGAKQANIEDEQGAYESIE